MNVEKIVLKLLAFLPCFFTFTNYFTVMTTEQRDKSVMGIIFLVASTVYFCLCLWFLIVNWNG
ncbi:hypothetical protein GvMRE_IIg209 [endosymbiont GvMRE of Glomus versiforme]|nr:hypothetical protein GvMRE_IIg209 [endosymbiont GvMRE of Glomus versiforme]